MVPALLAIFGPTGVGKTAVALAVADRLRARGERPVAVSADALQVYRGLEVLTGAADAADRARLDHRLVGVLDATETCSAGRYAEMAHAEIDGLLAEGASPIVVGGTGLYLRAALADLDLAPPPAPGVREALLARAADLGVPALHAELAARRPDVAGRIDPRDTTRVVRALELDAADALPAPSADRDELWTTRTRHPTRLVALVMDRPALFAAIGARVEAMVAGGAVDEVRAADAAGASATARRALGFDELLAHGDAPEAVAAMQARTRRYAKRQLTWLRRLEHAETIDVTGRGAEDVAAQIIP